VLAHGFDSTLYPCIIWPALAHHKALYLKDNVHVGGSIQGNKQLSQVIKHTEAKLRHLKTPKAVYCTHGNAFTKRSCAQQATTLNKSFSLPCLARTGKFCSAAFILPNRSLLLIFNSVGGFHCVTYGVTGDSSNVIAWDKSSKMSFFKSLQRVLMIVLSSSPQPTRSPLYSQLLFLLLLLPPLSMFHYLAFWLLFFFSLQWHLHFYFPQLFKVFLKRMLEAETCRHFKEEVKNRSITSHNVFNARESLLHK